jgi:hypothetical protein
VDPVNHNLTFLNTLSNEMKADVKMLGSLVIDRPGVVSKIYGSFIIAPDGGWHVHRKPELFKE